MGIAAIILSIVSFTAGVVIWTRFAISSEKN